MHSLEYPRVRRAMAALLLLAVAIPAHALLSTGPELQPATAPLPASVARRAAIVPAAQVRLDGPAPGEGLRTRDAGPSTRAQIGFGRSVAALRTAADVARRLTWNATDPQHRTAAIAITSPGASALRLALRMGNVPRGTRFRFAAATGTAIAVEAAEVAASVARNIYYDDDRPAAHVYWSPVIEGDTAVLEIELPLAASPADLQLAVPLVSHLVAGAADGFAAACGTAACDDAAGPGDGSAGVRIVFTEDGATYACNGMLLADRDPETVIPYFLTASHCVSSQSAASTVQPYWPGAGSACSQAMVRALAPGEQGATLMHVDAATDLTLLRLQRTPPAGAVYAGWVVGAGAGTAPVAAAAPPRELKVAYAEGAPERSDAAGAVQVSRPRLGECATGSSASARFEAAYNAGLYQWLGGTPQDAADAGTGAKPGGS